MLITRIILGRSAIALFAFLCAACTSAANETLAEATASSAAETSTRARTAQPVPSTNEPAPSSPAHRTAQLPALGDFSQTVLIAETADERKRLRVYVADTPAERARGLMGVSDLPDGSGMLFVFEEPSAGGFWMKNTLIPLEIAFLNESGRVLAVLDMQPCEADPCEVYTPGVTYTAAVEVEQGWFSELGLREGDHLREASTTN